MPTYMRGRNAIATRVWIVDMEQVQVWRVVCDVCGAVYDLKPDEEPPARCAECRCTVITAVG